MGLVGRCWGHTRLVGRHRWPRHRALEPIGSAKKLSAEATLDKKRPGVLVQQRVYCHGTCGGRALRQASTIRSIKSVVPLLDRVLVQRFKPETKTASGLFLPSSSASSPLPEASVIAAGPGAPDKDGKVVPVSVQTGDKILLPSWGGNQIKVGDEVRGVHSPRNTC